MSRCDTLVKLQSLTNWNERHTVANSIEGTLVYCASQNFSCPATAITSNSVKSTSLIEGNTGKHYKTLDGDDKHACSDSFHMKKYYSVCVRVAIWCDIGIPASKVTSSLNLPRQESHLHFFRLFYSRERDLQNRQCW